jgi:hypothetical protein
MTVENTCPRCGGVATVWADNSDGVTVNFRCPNETCRAGKGPWDTPEPVEVDNSPEAVEARRAMFKGFGW